jgi:inhibitor of KinA sporulation pathway (predicted exonuclease)
MPKKLDKILVIDIEATCWRDKIPLEQPSEIIEIGICVLETTTWERLSKDSIIVKPSCSEISPFCTELTTLTPTDIDKGISLKAACNQLQTRYSSPQYPWASYGDYDRRQFESECRDKQVRYPFGSTHINVKTLLALMQQWESEVGMVTALEKLGLPLEGTLHRGVDDAWNIAKILAKLLKKNT